MEMIGTIALTYDLLWQLQKIVTMIIGLYAVMAVVALILALVLMVQIIKFMLSKGKK